MTTATSESKYGLGILATKKGQYDQAVNYFGSEPSYNLALALLLKGDVNKAKVTLESLKNFANAACLPTLKQLLVHVWMTELMLSTTFAKLLDSKLTGKLMPKQTLNLPSISMMIHSNQPFSKK